MASVGEGSILRCDLWGGVGSQFPREQECHADKTGVSIPFTLLETGRLVDRGLEDCGLAANPRVVQGGHRLG